MITQQEALELFDYDPDTGILTNKVGRGQKAKVGMEAGSLYINCSGKSYKQVYIGGRNYRVHRLIFLMMTGSWPDTVDHQNGNGLDNRWENLRDVTQEENNRNMCMHHTNTSGVTGVSWYKVTGKWQATIYKRGTKKHLGYFENFDDAVAARRQAEIDYGFHENHGSDRPL